MGERLLGQSFHQVGSTPKVRRVWLRGRNLEVANFGVGQSYQVSYQDEEDAIVLRVVSAEAEGRCRRVAFKTEHSRQIPVIDIMNKEFTDFVGDCSKVLVSFYEDRVIIKLHGDEVARAGRLRRLAQIRNGSEPLRVGSICSGGGIMDHALHAGLGEAGVATKHVFMVEVENTYAQSACENTGLVNKETVLFNVPMERVDLRDVPKCDLLIAGLPCTGASYSGRSKNGLRYAEEHKDAGALVFAFLNYIKALAPIDVVLENVPAYEATASMAIIKSTLSAWGYDFDTSEMRGGEFGAFEDRPRMVFWARTRPQGDAIALDTQLDRHKRVSNMALGDLLDDEDVVADKYRPYEYLKAKEKADKAAGKGFSRQELTRDARKCGTIGRGYAKARSTEPFVQHPDDPNLLRLFTAAEHARVKQVPGQLVDGVCETTAHEILGQSVIYPAFKAVGEVIGASILKTCGEASDLACAEVNSRLERGQLVMAL